MARIKTISEDEVRGIRRALVWQAKRQYGYLPGIFQILMPDMGLARRVAAIYMKPEFATTWRTYELDEGTRALLDYAEKLTKTPSQIEDSDVEALRGAGWNEDAVYEATALISFFNFTGRMEAASGLPPDEVPAGATPPEARPD